MRACARACVACVSACVHARTYMRARARACLRARACVPARAWLLFGNLALSKPVAHCQAPVAVDIINTQGLLAPARLAVRSAGAGFSPPRPSAADALAPLQTARIARAHVVHCLSSAQLPA